MEKFNNKFCSLNSIKRGKMSKIIVAKFSVDYLQILNERGTLDKKLMPKLTKSQILWMYENMILTRTIDEKMLSMQRQGRLGTFAPVKGQEACQIGAIAAIDKNDVVVPAFRETAAHIAYGLPPENIFIYYAGDERGSITPKDKNFFPIVIPVATQCLHAVGYAWAAKIKKDNIAVVVFFGDGATSEGDFHEAMNFAGVFKVPILFICQNNQYAISVPRELQSASETLAQKALAYGFDGIQVDGNDVFAVYKAARDAILDIKKGKGPYFIECITYRLGDHTTADDALRYRTQKELQEWTKKDPILRLKDFIMKNKYLSRLDDEKLQDSVKAKVEAIVKKAESIESPSIEDIFRFTYKEMPWNLKEQLDDLRESVKDG